MCAVLQLTKTQPCRGQRPRPHTGPLTQFNDSDQCTSVKVLWLERSTALELTTAPTWCRSVSSASCVCVCVCVLSVTDGAGGSGQSQRGPNLHRYRPPPVHHSELQHYRCHVQGLRHREGNTRPAHGSEWSLLQAGHHGSTNQLTARENRPTSKAANLMQLAKTLYVVTS